MFKGSELRLARIFNNFSLEELGTAVGKTKQYLQRLETGQDIPTALLVDSLADVLNVLPTFFFKTDVAYLNEELFHFRKLQSTKLITRQGVTARGELTNRLINYLDSFLKLPKLNIPTLDLTSFPDVEKATEVCRSEWELGYGPITNMCRLAENIGVIVTQFNISSKDIDALSVNVSRPFIVRNDAKKSTCRFRFDIGHEIGHLVLHSGMVTGDRITESQANLYSSALMIPRSMMFKLFPKPKGSRMDWAAISEFKLTWKVSKAAILYRAHKLGLLSDAQYKSGVIRLNRGGEAVEEHEDYMIEREEPELLRNAFNVLANRKNIYGENIAEALGIKIEALESLVGFTLPKKAETKKPNLYIVS